MKHTGYKSMKQVQNDTGKIKPTGMQNLMQRLRNTSLMFRSGQKEKPRVKISMIPVQLKKHESRRE